MVVVIDIGISNIGSVANALDYLGLRYTVSDREEDIINASHIILPGVGTFEAGMAALQGKNLLYPLKDQVLNKQKPILGICLGMQLFFNNSEESTGVDGMGLISGSILKLPTSKKYTTPRIGWAKSLVKRDFLSLNEGQIIDFYYIHSYHASPIDDSIVAIITEKNNLTAAIVKENIFGCQFHAEKSHKAGLKILETFGRI